MPMFSDGRSPFNKVPLPRQAVREEKKLQLKRLPPILHAGLLGTSANPRYRIFRVGGGGKKKGSVVNDAEGRPGE